MDFTISTTNYEIAVEIATQTLDRFSSTCGHYSNTLNSHLRGKIGEIASSIALSQMGFEIDAVFEKLDRMAEADIIVPGKCRIEVKTWSEEFWSEMGRCVAIDQFGKLQRKADLVLWCSSSKKLEPEMNVTIHGWNLIEEVPTAPRRLTGPSNGRKVDNYQMDVAQLRPMDSLQNFIGQDKK